MIKLTENQREILQAYCACAQALLDGREIELFAREWMLTIK